MTEDGIKLLKKHEGLMLKPYRCSAGKLSIGYGRNLDDVGISKEEAEQLLRNDIDNCVKQLKHHLFWVFDHSNTVQDIIINMCFNLGIYGLLGFKKTLKLIEEGKYKQASIEMLDSNWAKQVGIRAKELSNLLAKEET